MADIVLPVPGENPNWGSKLNTAILRINQELEALGIQVSQVGSDLSSVTLRVTNLEGRVTQLEDDLEDEVRRIAADVIASDPAIIEAAENAVDEVVADLNIVQAYPETRVTRTSLTSIPVHWTYKILSSPYPATYPATYPGEWIGSSRRRGEVPILRPDGTLRESQIPDSIARLSDIPTVPEIPEVSLPSRILSRNVPILAARLATAKTLNVALSVVFVGSSTTYSMPGFVGPLGRMLQETWRRDSYTAVQRDSDADFIVHSSPGVHVYNAGDWGSTALSYLTDEESDRIAALDPALITHMIGSNDWRQGQAPATYRANLVNRLDYLDAAIAGPHQHVLVHQYERRDGTVGEASWDDYRQVLADLAAERPNVAFLDLSEAYYLAGAPTPDPLQLISSDDIHQTAQGYEFMTALYAAFFFSS